MRRNSSTVDYIEQFIALRCGRILIILKINAYFDISGTKVSVVSVGSDTACVTFS